MNVLGSMCKKTVENNQREIAFDAISKGLL